MWGWQQIKVKSSFRLKLDTTKGKIKTGQLGKMGKKWRNLAVDLNDDRQVKFLIKA